MISKLSNILYKCVFFYTLLSSVAFAQPTMDYEHAPLGIASGSTVFYPYQIKFPDNSYTDNGATGTITFTGTGHTIQDEGVSLTQRTNLNFVGAGVTASDNGADTVVTIPVGGATSASATIVTVFDGGGSAIATGATTWVRIPYAVTLTEWDLTSFGTAPILKLDIWKTTYAGFNNATGTSIVASVAPTLTAQQKNTNTTLTGWTKSFIAGDYLFFEVTNVDTATYAVLSLSLTK